MGDSGPAKRRAKYSFRARRNPRFSEGISDTEFEELMKEMERAVSSPTPDLPESPQRAPVAPMMENTDGELSSGLPDRNAESSAPSRTQAESAPKAKSGPGSSQMPPPPRASKKTPSPKQKPPKTHRVILKTKSSAASSVASARTHTKAVPTPVPKQPIVEDITRIKIPAMSPSLQADSEAGSLPKDGYQADGLLGATTATKQPTPSHSRAPPTPNHVQPKVQSSSSSVKNTASMEARQISTSQHAGSENNVLTTNHATGPIAPTSSAQGQKTKGKSSPTESASNQRSQPQMQMNFFIVIHEPREKSIFWPEGKIQGTSLSEFIAGVAKVTKRDCIERLDLTLKTSTLEATVPVATDNEASWLVAKKHFTEKLKAARVKAKAKGLDESADPEIYVEPFYGLGGGEVDAEEEGEDEEISFF
ncbi:hypothetical protein N431DRAFT_357571 [Stipitochalara longipes BDJ]|nr:hypothetical protein N431DRAFT_357571 [Stipitochalara longipes BDJ]